MVTKMIAPDELEPVSNRLLASITTLEVLNIAMDGEDDAPHIYFKMTLARVLRELNEHHDAIDSLLVGQVPEGWTANHGRARSRWLARAARRVERISKGAQS